MANYVLVLDEENPNIKNDLVTANISMGRLVTAFLSLVLPAKTVPMWRDLISLSLLVLFGMIMLYIVNLYTQKQNVMGEIAFMVLFITAPCHLYSLMFSYQSVQLSIGWVLIAIGIYLSTKNKLKFNIFSVICFAVSIGIYQAFAIVIFTLFSFIIAVRIVQVGGCISKNFIIYYIKSLGLILAAVMLYFAVNIISQMIIASSSGYSESYFRWGKIPVEESFRNIALMGYKLILGKGEIGYRYMPVFYVMSIFGILYGVIKVPRAKFVYVLTIIAICASTIIFPILLGNTVPARILFPVLVFPSIMSYIMFLLVDKEFIRKCMIVICLYIALLQAYNLNDLHVHEVERYNNDVNTAFELNLELSKVINSENKENVHVAIVCSADFLSYDSTVGISFFHLGHRRALQFMEYLGYSYQVCTDEEYLFAQEYASNNMQNWPMENSFVFIPEKDLVIINMQ
jgi:hypothetical protein